MIKTSHLPARLLVNFKLKPISVMVFALFTSQAFAEAITLAQVDAQNQQQKQCEAKAHDAQAKSACRNQKLQAQIAAEDADDNTTGEQESKPAQRIQIADASDVYSAAGKSGIKVAPEIIQIAEVTYPLALRERVGVRVATKSIRPTKALTAKHLTPKKAKTYH